MILSDTEIIERVAYADMIRPFVNHQVNEGVISYGLSSYGYDFRVANEFKILKPTLSMRIDPKNVDPAIFQDFWVPDHDFIEIPPNSFALARTVEYFKIPRDIMVVCLGKSTYARAGLVLNTTPFEATWVGFATLEISNTTPLPVKIYAGEGIGQAIFLKADKVCAVSYADRKGKYQGQTGITLAKVS